MAIVLVPVILESGYERFKFFGYKNPSRTATDLESFGLCRISFVIIDSILSQRYVKEHYNKLLKITSIIDMEIFLNSGS